MHYHSFQNEHGRFPVTTDVLQNIQHDIQMLSKAIAGMGGDAAIFTKGGDVAAVDGEVVESHGSGQRIKKLMDPKNFAVQGEIYDVLETTGYLNSGFGRTHSNMFDLPSKFASLEANDKQLRDTIELRSSDLNGAMATRFADYAAQLAELRNQLAQATAALNTQIANVEKHTEPKGAMGLFLVTDGLIERGWVPCATVYAETKKALDAFWGDKITYTGGQWASSTRPSYPNVDTCNGIPVGAYSRQSIALTNKTSAGAIVSLPLWIKCL